MKARNGQPPYVIPAPMLTAELQPHIDRITHSLDDEKGALGQIAARASTIIRDMTFEATIRRFYAIRKGEQLIVNTEFADALLLACDVMIGDTDLPTLAGTAEGARSMVETWAPELNELEKFTLTRELLKFSSGFVYGVGLEPEDIIGTHAAKAIGSFLRNAARVPELELVA